MTEASLSDVPLRLYHLTPSNILPIEYSASPLHLERGGNITTTEMRTPQGCHRQKLFDEVLRRHTNHRLSHSPPLGHARKMRLVTRTALDIYHLTPSNILRIENSASSLHLERGGNITTTEMRTPQGHEAIGAKSYCFQKFLSLKSCPYLTMCSDVARTGTGSRHAQFSFCASL